MHRIRVSWQRKRQTAAGCTSFNANDLEKKRKIKKSKTKTKLKCNRNQPPKTFAAIRRPSQVMQQPAKVTTAEGGRNCGNLEIPG